MSILVTGSAGHLGESLMRVLQAAERPVCGVDIKPSAFTNEVGSICDRDLVRRCMRGCETLIHTATLHKPHVATHSFADFLDTNISGTLILLEEAVAAGVKSFVFTSTTSAFGTALTPAENAPAVWVTEALAPEPKNIYGVTKRAAEDLCALIARKHGLPVIVLRTSRFFPEEDDSAGIREHYESANAQANELLYRRADIADIVSAHLLAVDRAPDFGWGRFIISAATPFTPDDCALLGRDTPAVVNRLFPDYAELYAARGWSMFPRIDRVYSSDKAMKELGWTPRYNFDHVLACLRRGEDFRSPLAQDIGRKGYHEEVFEGVPYPVE